MFRRRKYFSIIRFDDEGMKDVGLGKDGWSKQVLYPFLIIPPFKIRIFLQDLNLAIV